VKRALRSWGLLVLCLALEGRARADDVYVAVAGNFAGTLEKVAAAFHAQTGHSLVPSVGATGQLYAQIKAGAPFDVFLSADTERAKQLETEGLAVPDSRFVYARGKLVLWSPKADFVDSAASVLTSERLTAVAMANAKTAPYGAVAEHTLRKRGIFEKLQKSGKLAIGSSVTQVYQYVVTGAASCGFVALSQVLDAKGNISGSVAHIETAPVGALDQSAVLLKRAERNRAARAFMHFLRSSDEARAAIVRAGYDVESLATAKR